MKGSAGWAHIRERPSEAAVLACPGHHSEPNDTLVVVLNPPTEPLRARSEGGRAASEARGRIWQAGARAALPLAEPIYPTARCIHGVQKNLEPLKNIAAANQEQAPGEERVQ